MLTEYGKPELIANLLRKSDLWRFVDPDLKIWIKTPTLYEKVTSNLTNLHFAGERIVSCTGYHVFIVGRWGGPASPALLESCDKQLLSSACLGLAGGEDRRNATSFTCSRSTRQLLSHSRRGWAGSLAVWLCPDTWFASSAWDLIWVVWLRLAWSILLGLCRLQNLTLVRTKARGQEKKGGRDTCENGGKGSTKRGAGGSRQVSPQALWSGCLGGGCSPCVAEQWLLFAGKNLPSQLRNETGTVRAQHPAEVKKIGPCPWRETRVTSQPLSVVEDQWEDSHPSCTAVMRSSFYVAVSSSTS